MLDSEQPIYVVISHNFSREETDQMLMPIKTLATEIHFNRIRKYPKYQQPIKEILNHESINYDRIKIAYYNKKYALCAHLVDQLVETTYYNKGLKYYENGYNILFAKTLYLQAEYSELKDDYTELLSLFQIMLRKKDEESISLFYSHAKIIYNSIQEDAEKYNFFFPILKSGDYIDEILESINKFSIDLALPSIVLLSDIWYKNEKVKINIIHDVSKQVDFWKIFLIFSRMRLQMIK